MEKDIENLVNIFTSLGKMSSMVKYESLINNQIKDMMENLNI